MQIPDLKEIALAWAFARKPTPEQAAVAESRVNICNDCEFKVFAEVLRTYKCKACGCPISKKIYSPKGPSACPKGKWTE